jgi:hypothetical protein
MSNYPGGVEVIEIHCEIWRLTTCMSTPDSTERILFSENGNYTAGQNNYFRFRIKGFIFRFPKSQPL